MIGRGPRTYRLDVGPGAVDVARFAAHLARAAHEPGPPRRLAELDAALALWRGRPFAELVHPDVEPEVARLAGLRAGARAVALLAAGHIGEAVAAAEVLVATEPVHEGAVAILVRGLVAAGWPGDALRPYARLRAELRSSWAWTRHRSSARCTSRCCARSRPRSPDIPRRPRPARRRPSCRSARSSAATTT